MSKILFVRHGQSEANADKMIATARTRLSILGKQQATETGRSLRKEHVTKIVSSPMVRARQTAEIIAREIGYDVRNIHLIEELRERGFGEKEGGPKDHETPWYYQVDEVYGIESQDALIKRMRRCIQKLRSIAHTTPGVVVVVGHATAGFYLRQVAKGRSLFVEFDDPLDQKNAAIVELLI